MQFTHLCLQKGLEFFNYGHSVHMFIRNIFTPLYVNAQLAINLLYKLFANILTWYHLKTYIEDHLETYIEDTPRKMGSQDHVMNVIT